MLKDGAGGQFGRNQAGNFQGSIRSLSCGKPGTIILDTVQTFSLSEEDWHIWWELKGNEMQLCSFAATHRCAQHQPSPGERHVEGVARGDPIHLWFKRIPRVERQDGVARWSKKISMQCIHRELVERVSF